jgi:hypothetical protein
VLCWHEVVGRWPLVTLAKGRCSGEHGTRSTVICYSKPMGEPQTLAFTSGHLASKRNTWIIVGDGRGKVMLPLA